MSHALAATMVIGDTVFSLAPFGSTARYAAGSIRVKAVQSGMDAALMRIQPVVVAPGSPDPAAQTLQVRLSQPGAVLLLDSDHNPEVAIGQQYAKGFNVDAQGHPVATHLLITTAAGGVIQILVD